MANLDSYSSSPMSQKSLNSPILLLTSTNIAQLAELAALAVPLLLPNASNITPEHHSIFVMFCFNLLKATQLSSSCLVLGLRYLARFRPSQTSCEAELLTVALMLANKCLDDNAFNNKTWSAISKIPVHKLNTLERDFLVALDYKINPSPREFYTWAIQCQYLFLLAAKAQTLRKHPLAPQTFPAKRSAEDADLELSECTKRRSLPSIHAPYSPIHVYPPTMAWTPEAIMVSTSLNMCRPILSWTSASRNAPFVPLYTSVLYPTASATMP
ncbi:hypothetical protein CLU79DRAFT_760397 [Phycomyces nitens]|nr:hypothetical protein CLU79DRAFT_760397 [Phycomyces nitens]